jgi:hypothetical protein
MKTTDTKTRQGLRDWWHGILGKYDRYSCYALPLALPSDTEAIGYFGELGKELSLVSGKHCLVIALAGNQSNASCSEEEVWEAAIKEHIYQGYGMEIAEVFGIQPDEFPCVVLFEDIRSPEHVVVALEGMKTKEIATEMRSVFSVVRDAVSHGENALYAIQTHRERERSRRKSQARISQLRSTAEKTLEAVLKALVKRLVEQP